MIKGLFAAGVILSSAISLAWGAKGHEIVGTVGAQSTFGNGQEFWQANANGIRQLATVPDRIWKKPATKDQESPHHWFQIDAYVPDLNQSDILNFPRSYSDAVAKYGQSDVTKNGTAPWRIQQFYNLAVEAIRNGDASSAIEYVGVMTHYVGDLSQPLHDSANYDGVATGDKGIHKFFETTNIKDEDAIQAEVATRAAALLQDADFLAQFNGSVSDIVFYEASRAIDHRDEIINTDLKLGRRAAAGKAALLNIAEDRMADGAATLALILNRLWQDGGKTLTLSPVAENDPAWIAPDFTEGQKLTSSMDERDDDDCSLR